MEKSDVVFLVVRALFLAVMHQDSKFLNDRHKWLNEVKLTVHCNCDDRLHPYEQFNGYFRGYFLLFLNEFNRYCLNDRLALNPIIYKGFKRFLSLIDIE